MGGPEDVKTARDSGNRGEAAAAAYLEKKGGKVLARQWRCRFGELDLVVRDPSGTVCFVEVKLRGSGAIGLPREFVDGRKQEKLRRAALAYLSETGQADVPARFDVAEVYESGGGLRVKYLEDAFQ